MSHISRERKKRRKMAEYYERQGVELERQNLEMMDDKMMITMKTTTATATSTMSSTSLLSKERDSTLGRDMFLQNDDHNDYERDRRRTVTDSVNDHRDHHQQQQQQGGSSNHVIRREFSDEDNERSRSRIRFSDPSTERSQQSSERNNTNNNNDIPYMKTSTTNSHDNIMNKSKFRFHNSSNDGRTGYQKNMTDNSTSIMTSGEGTTTTITTTTTTKLDNDPTPVQPNTVNNNNNVADDDNDDIFGGFSLLKRFQQTMGIVGTAMNTTTTTNGSSSSEQTVPKTSTTMTSTITGGGIRSPVKRGGIVHFSDDDDNNNDSNNRHRGDNCTESTIQPLLSSTPVSQDNSVDHYLRNRITSTKRGTSDMELSKSTTTDDEGSDDELVFRSRRWRRKDVPVQSSNTNTETTRPNHEKFHRHDDDHDVGNESSEKQKEGCHIPKSPQRKRIPGRNPLSLEKEENERFRMSSIRRDSSSTSPVQPQQLLVRQNAPSDSNNNNNDDDDGFMSDCEPIVPDANEDTTKTGERSMGTGSNRRRKRSSSTGSQQKNEYNKQVSSSSSSSSKKNNVKSQQLDESDDHGDNDLNEGDEGDENENDDYDDNDDYEGDGDNDDDDDDYDDNCNPETLKPIIDDPQFGPDVPMEPLLLGDKEGTQQQTAVPASLNRYLPPFQREGVTFMYNCLARRSGVILGDEMGCGKTVQVIALLCALFNKTGTGKDLQDIKRRNRLVRDRIVALRKIRDEALYRGEVVEDDDKGWLKSLDLSPWHPVIIVVPPTIVEAWKKSFAAFTHFSVAVYSSQSKERSLDAIRYGRCDVLLVRKSLFASLGHFVALNKVDWKLIIIDEFHNYKGDKTKLSEHLRMLKAQHAPLVVGMTGTLMQNNHKELWNLCDLVETNYLGTWDYFRQNVARAIALGRQKGASKRAIESGENASRRLRESLRKIMIERKKEDVLGDLIPEKNEQVIFCELSPLQKEAYKHVVNLPDFELVKKGNSPCDCGINIHIFKEYLKCSCKAEQLEYYRTHKDEITKQSKCCRKIPTRKDENGANIIDPDAVIWRTLDPHITGEECKDCPWCCTFPCMIKLAKLSCHLALIQPKKTMDSQIRGSPAYVKYMKEREFAKVALVGVVNKLPGRDFDRSVNIMDDHYSLSGKLPVLDKILTKYYREGGRVLLFSHSTQLLDLIEHWLKSRGTVEYRRMDGQTALSKRQELADEYNRDSSIFLFLLSTKATGLGLTLTGANKVIIFDADWNPSWDEQAQDRAHRIGQKRDVNVVRLISKGTIEELIYLRQIYKNQLKYATLQESSDSKAAAPRMFRGVQGDSTMKGELFGTENLFKFKDGSFVDGIWAPLDRNKSDGLIIHESADLSKALFQLGEEYEHKLLGNEDVDVFRAAAERVVGGGQHPSVGKTKEDEVEGEKRRAVDTDVSDCCDDEKEKGKSLEFCVRAVNHADFFRSDRGRAAIRVEDVGYGEEMGEGTQDMYAVFENADVVDADHELEEKNAQAKQGPDAEKKDDKQIPSSPIMPDIPKSLPSLGHSCSMDEKRPPISDSKTSGEKSFLDDYRATPDKVNVQPTHASPGIVSDQRKTRKIPLVGIANVETERTVFSAADLLFPTYKKKKKKKQKKLS